jgi:hypothetical protein
VRQRVNFSAFSAVWPQGKLFAQPEAVTPFNAMLIEDKQTSRGTAVIACMDDIALSIWCKNSRQTVGTAGPAALSPMREVHSWRRSFRAFQ